MWRDISKESEWVFPPALSDAFIDAYANNSARSNDTESDDIRHLVSEAITNLTSSERVDGRYPSNTGFGSNDAVLRVGDVLEVDWKRGGNGTMGLDCFVCTAGAEGGLVENACDNSHRALDTQSASIYHVPDLPPTFAPRSNYTIPSLKGFFPGKDVNKTCALCIVNLFSPEGMLDSDYSVPFPVLQQPAYPHKRFSAEHPTGVEDPSISAETPALLAEPERDDGSKINVGMIIGVVVGVLVGTMLLALLYWWLWRKRKSRAKVVDSAASSTSEAGEQRTPQEIALQRIQGVVRRPETSASEVPPPYHEAVRVGNTPETNHQTVHG
ncbi:hypothetical protein K458DRAFT_450106 [Lentithecium fluviatile CBS 122367]|uniref:Uncharacterized protein n=1 Tax=Lentithecium fluviatile CBS 122367 TaxID=1168545 RepID=A0A6G1J506_9PLEO|nr:hypothetical protein K458DRAFT_450106 [Lentithecium fluviatile CBS 122367]